ncbi:MAG: SRPBCC family protein [Xanthomonadales bacterium]|nr:SRPBCC family protein [Xanthomonadales bacterium]
MSHPVHIYETFIRSTPDQIWKALTSSEFTRQYFHQCSVHSDWAEGSTVRYSDDSRDSIMEGRVLVSDPPRQLCYTWRFTYDPDLAAEGDSRVTFDIEPMGKVCRLRITHDWFDRENKTYEHISGGWAIILSSLKSLLETGQALPLAGNEDAADQRGAA